MAACFDKKNETDHHRLKVRGGDEDALSSIQIRCINALAHNEDLCKLIGEWFHIDVFNELNERRPTGQQQLY